MTMPVGEPPREIWDRVRAEREFWNAHQRNLIAQYPDQFVAIHSGSVLSTAYDLRDLIRDIEARGVDLDDVWVRFMAATHRAIAL